MSINEIRIGQYRFAKNLGNGSFGKVKMAFHEQTGHKVAIKILNKKKIRQYGVFEKVKRELKILRRFNNPHTIKLFEFIDTQSEIFMVLEYAAGGELFDLIARREKLVEDEARKIFQQIISSIEYSHQDKIAHRDLKPENLLLDENLNIRLIDFGLANIMRDSLSLKTACGSPNYAAPEVISGMSYGGAEVDVWSCGVILYAMVCGSLPFDDDQMPQLFNKIKECRYFIPNNLSPGVQDLINRMLQPNPVKRITLQEIQEHNWYQKALPDYLHFISKQQMNTKNSQIDTQIVQELFTLNLNIQKNFDEVCQDILNKRNTDYCGAYELIKHDKLKNECFKIPGKDKNEDEQKQKKKQGKLRSVQQIIEKNKKLNVLLNKPEEAQNTFRTGLRGIRNKISMTSSHLQRLNKINARFRRDDEYQLAQLEHHYRGQNAQINNFVNNPADQAKQNEKKNWLNLKKYENLSTHKYPKNPFANERNNQISLISQQMQPNSFHVGMKFQGDPHEMMKLVCYALVKIEIEWQYDTKEMKLKCRTKVDDEKLVDDDKFIEDFIRQQFLKFYVYINKLVKNQSNISQPKKRGPPAAQNQDSSGKTLQSGSSNSKKQVNGEYYIVNLYLQKGTIPVFFEMADQFFSIIQQKTMGIDRMSAQDKEMYDHASNQVNKDFPSNQMDHAMATTAAGTSVNDNEQMFSESIEQSVKKQAISEMDQKFANYKFNLEIIY